MFGMQQNEVDYNSGFPTWMWDSLPEVRQKPLEPKLADPKGWFFGRGAHLPILVYLQDKKNDHRQIVSILKRSQNKRGRTFGKAGKVQKQAMKAEPQGSLKGRRGPRVGKPGGGIRGSGAPCIFFLEWENTIWLETLLRGTPSLLRPKNTREHLALGRHTKIHEPSLNR